MVIKRSQESDDQSLDSMGPRWKLFVSSLRYRSGSNSRAMGNHVSVESIPQTHPDLILDGYWMPGIDGVLATKEVKEHYPLISKIIILT